MADLKTCPECGQSFEDIPYQDCLYHKAWEATQEMMYKNRQERRWKSLSSEEKFKENASRAFAELAERVSDLEDRL